MDRAGFYPRAGAFLLDLLIFMVIGVAASVIDILAVNANLYNEFGAITGAGAVLVICIDAAMEIFGGGTTGRRIMGLVVLAEDGGRPTRAMLFRRTFIKYSPAFLYVFPVILFALVDPYGPSMPGFMRFGITIIAIVAATLSLGALLLVTGGCFRSLGSDRQALHDLAARTAVFWRQSIPTGHGFTPVMPVPAETVLPKGNASAN